MKTKIKNFLYYAKKDLEASKILYERGMYFHSVFWFQQSVEKCNKAFGFITNRVKNPRDIWHQPIDIHKKVLEERKENGEIFLGLVEEYPQLKEGNCINLDNVKKSNVIVENLLNDIINLKQYPNKVLDMSEEEINNLIKEIEKIKNIIPVMRGDNEIKKINYGGLNKFIHDIVDIACSHYPEFNDESYKQNLLNKLDKTLLKDNTFMVDYINIIEEALYPYLCCAVLSLLVIPYKSIKYPDDYKAIVDGILTEILLMDVLTEKHPFVKSMLKLIQIQAETIEQVEKIQLVFEEFEKKYKETSDLT